MRPEKRSGAQFLVRLRDNAGGAAALEFAIVGPVFLAMILAIFNLGYALYCGAAVRGAVEQASRVLVATPSTSASTLNSAVQDLLVDVPVQNLAVTVATENVTSSVQVKRISWTYDYPLSSPFVTDATFAMGSSVVVPMPVSN